jgi:hypothetical protein
VSSLRLYHYNVPTPSSEDVQSWLGLPAADEGRYLYVVATAALETQRKALTPPTQRDEAGKEHLVFRRFMQLLLHRNGIRVLSRVDERILLWKTIEESSFIQPNEQELLRHDVFALMRALSECAEKDIDLRSPFPQDVAAQLVSPRVGQLLQILGRDMQTQFASVGREPLSRAATAFLRSNAFRPPQAVILEGFTFFTPLQHAFILACISQGTHVTLLFPYRHPQRRGFAAIWSTYRKYRDDHNASSVMKSGDWSTEPGTRGLFHLQTNLFAESMAPPPTEMSGVEFVVYRHQSEEVATCIRRIADLCNSGTLPENIAIVTRDPGAFHSRLQEEAQIQRLSVSLGLPPRMLLLTPLGRFILLLYQVYADGLLRMDADQFEAMLASGWLGARFQSTVESFHSVRSQFFENCRTAAEWMAAIDRAEHVRRALEVDALQDTTRMPAACVDRTTLIRWREALHRVSQLCASLFAGGERTVREHIRLLQEELQGLSTEAMRRLEVDLLERIRDAFAAIEDAESVPVSAREFGQVLNSLINEYRRQLNEPDEDDPVDDGTVAVTTPEGIDCSTRDYVFYLGVDSERVPRRAADPWPFFSNEVDDSLKRERYFFLAVIRAARQQITLSYAERGVYRASPFLLECAECLGTEIAEQPLPDDPLVEQSDQATPLVAAQDYSTLTLNEVAHFALCPFRFKLERLSPNARRYRSEFTTKLHAESVWINRILDHLADRGEAFTTVNGMEDGLRDARHHTAQGMREDFPALREDAWITVSNHVENWCARLAAFYFGDNFVQGRRTFLSFKNNDSIRILEYSVRRNDDIVSVPVEVRHGLRVSQRTYPILDELLLEEWLLPGKKPADPGEPSRILLDGVNVFASDYHAIQWWQDAVRTAFYFGAMHDSGLRVRHDRVVTELNVWMNAMAQGRYPKNIGVHCNSCPARSECLGLDP